MNRFLTSPSVGTGLVPLGHKATADDYVHSVPIMSPPNLGFSTQSIGKSTT